MKRIESKRACPIWRRSWRRDHFFKHRLQPNFFFQGSIVYSGTYQRCRIGKRQTTTGRRTKARGPCEWRFRWDDESRSVGLRRLSLPVRRSYPIEYTTQSPDFPAFATPSCHRRHPLSFISSSCTPQAFSLRSLRAGEFACTSDPPAFVN